MNKMIRTLNGNGINTIKLIHWNLGSRGFARKRDDIQHMVDKLKPDIAAISEANLSMNIGDHMNLILGYNILTTKDAVTNGFSRLVVLVREGTRYELLDNVMDHGTAAIWMKIPLRGRRPLTIGCIYQEHQLIHLPNLTESGSEASQVRRWRMILQQWIQASNSNDTVVVGDLNLDVVKWLNPDQGITRMVDDTNNSIVSNGFQQLIGQPTRFWKDKTPSLLDHIWTNNPNKIIEHSNTTRAVGDHNLISCTIRTKGNPRVNSETMRRKWETADIEKIKNEIGNKNWGKIYEIESPDLAYNYLEENIREVLDRNIPVKKIPNQTNKQNCVNSGNK